MESILSQLILNDKKLRSFTDSKLIIEQGLAPLISLTSNSIYLRKSIMLEKAKLINWKQKAKQLFESLNQNNVNFIVLKGFAYTHMLYEKDFLRPYSDIDIFIEKKNCKQIELIFKELQYNKFQSRQGKFVSFQNSFYDENPVQAIFDVHWEINNRIEFHKYFPFDAVYKASELLKSSEIAFRTLSHEMAFIYGCFHFIAHRPEDRKHIWLYDLALLWIKAGTNKKVLIHDLAKNLKQSKVVYATLTKLKKTFGSLIVFDWPVDEESYEETESYFNDRINKAEDIKIRIKNIKGIRNKFKFISEYVFQSSTYMQNRFKVKSNKWIYLYYPRMWLEDILKIFK